MANDVSAWDKEASDVLGEGTSEEQTSSFQITMPYVVLQIMQRLEPNHSVQVSAAGSADKRLNISCSRSSSGDELVFSVSGVDIDPDVVSGMSAMAETITAPVFSSSLDVPVSLCDADVLTSMSSVTNDVIFNDSGDSQSCRIYPPSDFAAVDVMKECAETEIVHGPDSAAGMLDADGRLASAVGAGMEPLFILSGTADSELSEPNTGTHSPQVRHDVTAYRCTLCTGLSYSLDRAIQHAKRQHSIENANSAAVDIVPELLSSVYYCRVCEAPSRTTYHWQSHMRRRHHIAVDRRRKPGADPRIRERKRLASLKDKSFVPIECVACGRQMRLTESYYLHIRRSHRGDGNYAAALTHLDEVRRARRELSSCRTVAVTPCPFCGIRVSSVRHLMLVHPKEPTLDVAVAAARNRLRHENVRQRNAKVECANCGRRMSRLHMRTHLQYHCAVINVIPELNIGSSVLLEMSDNSSNNILSLDPPAVPDDCTAIALPDELAAVENQAECEMLSADDVCSGPLYNQSVKRMVTCTERTGDSDEICGKRLNVKAYSAHRRKIHCKANEKDEKVIMCLLCQRTFMHQFSYSEHFQKTHLRRFLHSCDSCGRGFWKRTDKMKHRCKPENRAANVWNNEQLQLKAKHMLDSWQGPLYVEMNRSEASDFPPPIKRQVVKKAWQNVLCILCSKTFSSLRCYQQHHKHVHLLKFDHECSACGLCFLSRHSFKSHHCLPRRRRVNLKKREVLAARMREKIQSTSEPYFVFVDSDNQVVGCTGDSEASIKEVCLEQSLPVNPGSARANETNSDNSIDRLENDDTSGSGFLQTDTFQLTENSEAVLSCLPQCERELLQSAAVSAELEMDVCDDLKLGDGCAGVEQSVVYGNDENLLADATAADDDDDDGEKIPAENGSLLEHVDGQESSSSFLVDAELQNGGGGGTAGDPGRGQQWPMATPLGNGRLRCNVCRKELRVANYYPHMRRVHNMPSSQSRPITWKVCDRCGYQCQDNYKLRRHAMKHTRYEAGSVMCELCDRLFYELVDYKHHFKRCHLGQFNIRCDACYKGFWKRNALRQHACYPEMRAENVALQREQEADALRRRSEIRASMGLDDGTGINVNIVDVVEARRTDNDGDDAEPLLDDAGESKPVEILPLYAGGDDKVVPSWFQSAVETSSAATSQNISETNAELLLESENSRSNTHSKPEADTLLSHGYGTRKKRISFRELLQCS